MKKLITLLTLCLVFASCENETMIEEQLQPLCDNVFVGYIHLRSQEEVDAFGAMGYCEIDGYLLIGSSDDDITDLSSLSTLTKVNRTAESQERLRIYSYNLTNLNGLNNITEVNGLYIEFCSSLVDISGLSGLTTVAGNGDLSFNVSINDNHSLQSLEGLNNLTTVGNPDTESEIGLRIGHNRSLESFDALSSLTAVYGSLETTAYCGGPSSSTFCGNESLADLCSLQNLFTNGTYGEVNIDGNAYNPTVQDIIDGNCAQ